MKWIVLLALVSCTSPQKNAEQASQSTESNAKPASPYTVQPCYCMKIFQPVCANGENYGNSCEAECQGHKTWKEGSCTPRKK